MIHWFKSRFLGRNLTVAPIMRFLTKPERGYWTIPEDRKQEAQDLLAALYEIIQKDTYKYAVKAKVSAEDMEQMLSLTRKT